MAKEWQDLTDHRSDGRMTSLSKAVIKMMLSVFSVSLFLSVYVEVPYEPVEVGRSKKSECVPLISSERQCRDRLNAVDLQLNPRRARLFSAISVDDQTPKVADVF